MVNEKGVEYAIKIGLALGCEIAETCRFARKNYFYPDVPKDFQTSQSDEPIASEGQVEVELEDGTIVTVPVERAHMEEDAGKNTHVRRGHRPHPGRRRIPSSTTTAPVFPSWRSSPTRSPGRENAPPRWPQPMCAR